MQRVLKVTAWQEREGSGKSTSVMGEGHDYERDGVGEEGRKESLRKEKREQRKTEEYWT